MEWKYDPARSKFTREMMTPLIAESRSFLEVIRKLGLKPTGSANGRIRSCVKVLGLDTSHFLGLSANCGPERKGGTGKMSWREILVYDRHNGRKEHAFRLRRSLIESGIEEKCEECGMPPVWNGKPITLQVDHRNGDCVDNRPGNPRFMCPNCHAQTPTFGSKNVVYSKEKKPWAKGRTKKRRVWKDGVRISVPILLC